MATEQVSQELINSIIISGTNAISKAATFAVEQLPDIQAEIISHGYASVSLDATIGLLAGIVATKAYKLFANLEDNGWNGEAIFLSGGAAFVAAITSALFLLSAYSDFTKLLFSPKIYVIEHLKTLVR